MARLSMAPVDRPAFFAPDFFGQDPTPWWAPTEFTSFSSAQLKQHWPELAGSSVKGSDWVWQEPEPQIFNQEIKEILNAITSGQLRKAVPIVMSPSDRLPSLEEKMKWWAQTFLVPSRWIAYGGWWQDEGLMGLSPEILFSTQTGWTETMALAGTAPNPGPPLLESEKDLHEHQLVVQDITRQLSQLGEVKSTPTREWALGKLKHLRTDLSVEAGADFMQLVRLLHPTAALGVAPRQAGLGILQKSAYASKRRRFGAPFGVSLPGEMGLCCVAIRGLQWHEGKTWLSSGCGVVAGSDPAREWQELNLKRSVVAEQFGLKTNPMFHQEAF
ncbi:MAG: chorismate-binding protein [Bdellovibrionales bacterium]